MILLKNRFYFFHLNFSTSFRIFLFHFKFSSMTIKVESRKRQKEKGISRKGVIYNTIQKITSLLCRVFVRFDFISFSGN